MLLAMLALLLFSRTINISPDKVKALANSGSSGGDSGHPPGTHQSPPVPLPGEQQLLSSPSQWGAWSRSSCPSQGMLQVRLSACSERCDHSPSLPPSPAPVFSDSPSAPQPPPTWVGSRTLTCMPSTCQRLGLPTAAHPLCQAALSLIRPASLAPLEVPFTHPSSSLGEAKPTVTAFPGPLVSTCSVTGLDSVPPFTFFQACPATATRDRCPWASVSFPAGLATAISSSCHPAFV